MNVSVHLELPTQSSVTLRLKRAEGVKGYEHDVSFEPAGISPDMIGFPPPRSGSTPSSTGSPPASPGPSIESS